MSLSLRVAVLALTASTFCFGSHCWASPESFESSATSKSKTAQSNSIDWRTNYGQAWREAEQSGKMLFVWFEGTSKTNSRTRAILKQSFVAKNSLVSKLDQYVPVRVKADTEILSGGKPVRLLKHDAFREMQGAEGIAVIDLVDKKSPHHGHVVSAFPLKRGKYYTFRPQYLPVILDLPQGTITQRTMIWAVRVHPERPASTRGEFDGVLRKAASSHSRYQADIGVQGHHRWEGRFHRLQRLLGGRYAPVEVVAESWPNQTMLDSCIDCVDSWRQSSGHWQAVSGDHALYGYDIRRGGNGIWYGTGIFAGRR